METSSLVCGLRFTGERQCIGTSGIVVVAVVAAVVEVIIVVICRNKSKSLTGHLLFVNLHSRILNKHHNIVYLVF